MDYFSARIIQSHSIAFTFRTTSSSRLHQVLSQHYHRGFGSAFINAIDTFRRLDVHCTSVSLSEPGRGSNNNQVEYKIVDCFVVYPSSRPTTTTDDDRSFSISDYYRFYTTINQVGYAVVVVVVISPSRPTTTTDNGRRFPILGYHLSSYQHQV
jgi:hypothetical protein